MRKFNLGRKPSPQPEGEDPETLMEEEGAAAEKPAGGDGQRRRLLLVLLAVLVVAAGGYFAYDLFVARKPPQPPARPIRPIAKAPSPPALQPAGAPVPGKAPASSAPPGASAPAPAAKAPGAVPPPGPAPSAPLQKAVPPGPVASLPSPSPAGAPAKADTKVDVRPPAAKRAEPSKAAPAVPPPLAPAPGPPPAGPAPAAQPAAGSFSLQVGAMATEANAQKLKQRLEQMGLSPVIRKGSAHIRRHVVTVGDFPDRAGAEDLAKRLTGHGIKGRVDTATSRFYVEAGSFLNEDDAIDLARELQKLNYPPKIQDRAQNTTLYQVRIGSFATRADAQARGAELKSKGFPYLVVKN